MKRVTYFALVIASAFAMASCKTTENSYKQAYEKAIQKDVPKSETRLPATPVRVTEEDVASVPVREEKVTVVTGEPALKEYSVVCGSFSLKVNADAVRKRLVNDGYPAVVAVNEAGKTFRVISSTFDTKEEAVAARAVIKAKYPDNQDFQASWILYRK